MQLVFCGSVLMHLRDQLLALERIASVSRDRFVLAEEYDRLTSLVPAALSRYRADREPAVIFWAPNVRAWKRMVWSAGFDEVSEHARLRIKVGTKASVPHVVLHARKRSTG